MKMGKALTAQQVVALEVSERVMSILSIVGSVFIVGTFIKWEYFRKPINRLVFYASFGNVMANVATLISTSALPGPHMEASPLCQFQAILIQWFLMADSLWVFCMALNVMLVFFHHYQAPQLRRLEKYYLCFSYGLPAIPAITYIIMHHVSRPVLGGATIWCWVVSDMAWMRIAFFYGPVWIVLLVTICIYLFTGRTIFRQRAELRTFRQSRGKPDQACPPAITNPFTAVIHRKTEISVQYSTDITNTIDSDSTTVIPACESDSRSSFASTQHLSANTQNPTNALSNIVQSPCSSPLGWSNVRATSAASNKQEQNAGSTYQAAVSADVTPSDLEAGRLGSVTRSQPTKRNQAPPEKTTAAWSYFKVAFLMFAALFVVWVPSTVNRLQQFTHGDRPIFALNLASALVLPLQGFWNAMVYMSTTWPECKRAIKEIMGQAPYNPQPTLRNNSHRHNSDRTLAGDDAVDDTEIPLSEMLRQDPQQPTLDSSTNMAKAHSQKRWLPRMGRRV